MISWAKLITGSLQKNDSLRFSPCKQAPKIVIWNVTRQCNLFCRHCYLDAADALSTKQLSLAEGKAFIEDLAKFGVSVLLFSGGEPLLRKDIFALANFAKEQGLSTALSTNGTLITEEAAVNIKEAGFSYVGISLDGNEKTNDCFRQKQGAFSEALGGIRNCRKIGLKVGLRFTLTKFNFKDLGDIFEIAKKEKISRVCFYHLVYTGRGSNLREEDLNGDEKRWVLEFLWQKAVDFHRQGLDSEILTVDNHADGAWIYLKLRKESPGRAAVAFELLKIQGGNASGINIACVDEQGNVYADQFLRSHVLGNILKEKFSATWSDSKNTILSGLRQRRLFLKGRCLKCNFLSICNGNLRSRAEVVSGDLWQDDPSCYLTDDEIYGDSQRYSAAGCAGVNA